MNFLKFFLIYKQLENLVGFFWQHRTPKVFNKGNQLLNAQVCTHLYTDINFSSFLLKAVAIFRQCFNNTSTQRTSLFNYNLMDDFTDEKQHADFIGNATCSQIVSLLPLSWTRNMDHKSGNFVRKAFKISFVVKSEQIFRNAVFYYQ